MIGRRERGRASSSTRSISTRWCRRIILVRQIDGVLDLDWVHKELSSCYWYTGRPWIRSGADDPDADCGTVFAIRSERRLCTEVQVNLAYRWFCKLGIKDGIPDHRQAPNKSDGDPGQADFGRAVARTALPRLISSISRDTVDHLVVLGEQHLHSVLRSHAHNYRCLASKMPDFNISCWRRS